MPIPPRLTLRLKAIALALSAALTGGCHVAPKEYGRIHEERPLSLTASTPPDETEGTRPTPTHHQPAPDLNDRLPRWVIDPSAPGVVGAVGVASRGERGAREQLDEARLNGRMELASMFEVRLQRVARNEIEETDRTRRDLVTVDRDIVDVVIAGSRQRAVWFDPLSGECYVWMVLDAKILDRVRQVVVAEGVSVLTASDPDDEPPRGTPGERGLAPDEPAPTRAMTPEAPAEKREEKPEPVKTLWL